MPRLTVLDETTAPERTRKMFESVKDEIGMIPNLYRGLGNSPAALGAYLAGQEALEDSRLSAAERETIALAVSQINGCDYCLAAHTAIGKMVGLDEDEIVDIRRFTAGDERRRALVEFTETFVEGRGWVDDEDVDDLREAGFSDGEIAEIPVVVALTFMSNWFNHLNGTEVDFPEPAAV